MSGRRAQRRFGWRFRSLGLLGLLCAGGCADDSTLPAVGTLERDRLELVAESSEPVLERPVKEGAFVKAGELLLRLDPARLEAQVAAAQGARARAEARLAELVRGPRGERIEELRARLTGAEGRLRTAWRELARTKELLARGVAPQQALDQQHALYDEARAARDSAQASLSELEDGTTDEELAQAKAAVAEADATLAETRIRLERLQLHAPRAGWVDALPYELGERPPTGGVLVVLLAGEAPYARVYVPEAIRSRVTSGTLAQVRVDGIAEPIRGRVRSVESDASFTPYYALTERDRGRLVYLGKVDLDDAAARALPAGVPVEVVFELQELAREPGDDSVRR